MNLNIKHALVTATIFTAAFNAQASDTVRVFFLAGQSNMQGHGQLEIGHDGIAGAEGSLRYEVNNDPTHYGHLVDGGGNWVTRSDVWVWNRNGTTDSTGDLGVTFGVNSNKFGPELGIGHVLGDYYDDQVVLIKTAWGGKSLAVDFRPPSAVADRGGTLGAHYTLMVNSMNEALADVATQFAGKTIEIEGLAWHQGWNDRGNDARVAEYEDNLNDMIADLRSELSTPDLKVVIGTTSMGQEWHYNPAFYGTNDTARRAQDLVAAQENVGAADALAETVNTLPFFRDQHVSPANEPHHWYENGESYYLVGESMGEAMVALVPEPSSLMLFALGGMAMMRRRRP